MNIEVLPRNILMILQQFIRYLFSPAFGNPFGTLVPLIHVIRVQIHKSCSEICLDSHLLVVFLHSCNITWSLKIVLKIFLCISCIFLIKNSHLLRNHTLYMVFDLRTVLYWPCRIKFFERSKMWFGLELLLLGYWAEWPWRDAWQRCLSLYTRLIII